MEKNEDGDTVIGEDREYIYVYGDRESVSNRSTDGGSFRDRGLNSAERGVAWCFIH